MQQLIEVNQSALMRCGYTRDQVQSALADIAPSSKKGRSVFYDLSVAIKALNASQETAKERALRLDAEIKQVKLDRLKGEQVNASEVELLFAATFKRLADAIKNCEEIPPKRRRAICNSLRAEIERNAGDVKRCRFEI